MLNRIPDKNLIVEVECWGEGSVPATDVSIMNHDKPEWHVDDNGDDIKFTDFVLIDGQWGVKDAPQIGVSTNYVERHPDIYDQIKQLTTKNDLGVDTDKLIADCEKMSFDFELFGRPTKALLLDAVKNIVKDLPSVTPQESKILALLDKTFNDFCNCPGGESYFHIDGEDYNTDVVYALEGMEIFIKVLKKRLAESRNK